MGKDIFFKEKVKDMFNLYTLELVLYTAFAVCYVYYFAFCKHEYLPAATAILVFAFLFYSSVFSLKYSLKNLILVPQTDISVDCKSLNFSLDGETYNFCDMLPTYSLTKYRFNWSKFNIPLKSGKEVKFMLPKNVAESFEKYVSKYSKADVETSKTVEFPM